MLLALASDGVELLALCYIHFTPIENRYQRVGGFLGPRVYRYALKKRDVFGPCQKTNHNPISCPGSVLVTALANKNRRKGSQGNNQFLPLWSHAVYMGHWAVTLTML
jgi:hypothetical protein